MCSELIHHKEIHQDVYNYAKAFKYHHASLKPLDLPSVVFSGLHAWFSSAAELGAMLVQLWLPYSGDPFQRGLRNYWKGCTRPPKKRTIPTIEPIIQFPGYA